MYGFRRFSFYIHFFFFFYLCCFNHIKLYNLPVSYTAKEFSGVVFLNGSLKSN